jgi:hypothetical protein
MATQEVNSQNPRLPGAPQKSAWSDLAGQLRSVDVIGATRKTAVYRIHRVAVDGPLLHRSLTSFYKRLLVSRIRRTAPCPANSVIEYADRGSRYLSRLTIESMAVVLRNKLEQYGEIDLSHTLLDQTPITIGARILKPISTLIETFGTYKINDRYHDRVLYVAILSRGGDRRFGCSNAEW